VMEEYVLTTSALELSKKSYFFSVSCLCLPGLLYNLQKMRQLNCARGVCLRDYTASGISSVKDCNDQFVYDRCVYVWGQFTSIAFSTVISDVMKMFVDFVKDPTKYGVSAAWFFAKKGTRAACTNADTIPNWLPRSAARVISCIGYTAVVGFETVQGFTNMANTFNYFKEEPEVDWCDKLYNPQVKQDEGAS
jgi:hypothetical protein